MFLAATCPDPMIRRGLAPSPSGPAVAPRQLPSPATAADPADRLRRVLLRGAGAWGAAGWLGGLGLAPGTASAAADAAPRPPRAGRTPPPMMLAEEAPEDIDPRGWLVSEKYDGVRAWWDGRELRTRSGLPLAAPARFLRALPEFPLDGELWLGRGRFDELSGIVRRTRPDEDAWREVRYMVFELPGAGGRFDTRARALRAMFAAAARTSQPETRVQAVEQTPCGDRRVLQAALARLVAQGGEGLMLHRADAPEIAGRSPLLLKLKPLHDDEATVVGHQPGRGRLAGRLGALRVRDDAGRHFEIGTGFTDVQRAAPPALGTRVTFTHRGRTPDGLPRFASYLRQRTH